MQGGFIQGATLKVQAVEEPGQRVYGKYDHRPLSLTLPLQHIPIARTEEGEGDGRQGRGPGGTWRWNNRFRDVFCDAVMIDLPSLEEQLRHPGMTGQRAAGIFQAFLENSLKFADTKCGGKLSGKGGRRGSTGSRPPNPWYNGDCKAARQTLGRAEKEFGASSAEAVAARSAYRRCIQRAKRQYEISSATELVQQYKSDPRSFWKSFQDQRAKANSTIPLSEWSTYFAGLFSGTAESGYVGGSFDSHCAHYADLFGAPCEEALAAAKKLNEPFTVQEVLFVLRKLANHKAAGVDGVPAEFYKLASVAVDKGARWHLLASPLAQLFNLVLKGDYPDEWQVGALVPVPKPKANHSEKDGYRGIAVGLAIGKIYSMLLLKRLDVWAEEGGLRAAGQAGFRHGRGTPDNVFVLRHIFSKYRAQKKPVFAAFIDFKKAYDCVDHQLLWRCLHNLGLNDEMMSTLQQMYSRVQMRVKVDGQLGEAFPSDRGVRQGDPLSPLLFGLFIDRFEAFLAARLPGIGVKLGSVILQLLFYADDLALLAESKKDLQAMLEVLHDFCKATGMTVNVKKSEVVVYNSDHTRSKDPTFSYSDQAMPLKEEFVYLGVSLHSTAIVTNILDKRVTKARAAMHAMLRRCFDLKIHSIYLRNRLFDSMVVPVLNYGCEVWGADYLSRLSTLQGLDEAERMHLAYLRQSLGVRKATSRAVMLAETKRQPLCAAWLKQSLRFYNKLLKREADDVVRLALEEDIALARAVKGRGSGQTPFWSFQLAKCLKDIGCRTEADALLRGETVNAALCVQKLDEYHLAFHSKDLPGDAAISVRSQPDDASKGFKLMTYQKWFQSDIDCWAGYVYHVVARDRITALARFRMSSHNLGIETGRWGGQAGGGKRARVARSQRLCPCCTTGERDDEMHVFHCPAYSDLRATLLDERMGPLGDIVDDTSMRKCMNAEGLGNHSRFWNKLAIYLLAVESLRSGPGSGSGHH